VARAIAGGALWPIARRLIWMSASASWKSDLCLDAIVGIMDPLRPDVIGAAMTLSEGRESLSEW
jgi:hypothetical protein